MAKFKVTLICCWAKGGSFTPYIGPKAGLNGEKKAKKSAKKKQKKSPEEFTMEVEAWTNCKLLNPNFVI